MSIDLMFRIAIATQDRDLLALTLERAEDEENLRIYYRANPDDDPEGYYQ